MQVSLFPELIKASCSMFGAWGEANTETGNGLIQLRALDWNTNGPFQKYPLLLTYHPASGNGHNFTTLTWAGLVGALTGMSSAHMGICEKVWDHYTGIQNIVGYPWTFLLQDILQFDVDTDQALSRIATANRTCGIFVGLGEGGTAVDARPNFRALEYSYETVNIYNSVNFPAYPPWHPLFKDLVFIDKHTQPSHNLCFGSLLAKYYGSISPENTLQYITAIEQTGDMHVAIYDYDNGYMYLSNASPVAANGSVVPAYARQFIRADMTALWSLELQQ